jgi:LuxR family transcriptional regulator, maltose regulon positive regulatory protein
MTALLTDDCAAPAPDWTVNLPSSIAESRDPTSGDTWAIRRAIVCARSALLRTRVDEAARAIARLNRVLSSQPHCDRVRYSRAVRVLQACSLAVGEDFAAARRALATLPALRGDVISMTLRRYLDWKCGSPEQACAPEGFDYLAAPTRGCAVYKILNLCMSSAGAFERLHLTVCAALAGEAFRLAEEHYGSHSPLSCFPATLLAQVAYEQGRFEDAEALLAPRLQMIRTSGLPECMARATVLLARLSFHRGRQRAALTILQEAEAVGRARRWPMVASAASSEHARLFLRKRCDESASAEPCARGGCARADSRDDNCLEALTSSGSAPRFSTIAHTLERLAAGSECHDLLVSCLRVGAARGLRMIFVDAGPPILALLKSLYCALSPGDPHAAELRAYIATILQATAPPATEDAAPPTYRHLSRREAGILRLIAHGMSNKRIALSLGITPETVKTHTKSIFVKLGTRTRAQAVARAEAVGLL